MSSLIKLSKLSNKSLEALAEHCHQLRSLALDNCSLISPEMIEAIRPRLPYGCELSHEIAEWDFNTGY